MKRLKAITKRVTSSSSKEKESSSRRFSISSHKDIQVIRGGYNIDLTHVDDSFTRLHRSCLLNESEDKVAKCITSQGINPNEIDQVAGSAPLHLAIVNGNLNNVRVLLTHGADVDLKDGEGKTPLIKAIESSHEQLVKFLVYNNANPNLADTETGNTALMWAIQTNMISAVKILMGSSSDSISSFPVDVNRRNVRRETALHLLAKSSLLNEVLPLVLENQAMVNVQDEKGRTPLIVAAFHGNRVAVEAFLKKGADCSLRDSSGITALDTAKINGFPEIASLVEGHQGNLTGSSSGSFRGRLVGSDPSPGQAILMNWSDSDDDNENESSIEVPVQLRMKQQSLETRRSSQVTRQSKESNQDFSSQSSRESVSSFNPVIEQLQMLQGIEKKKNTNEEGGAGGESSDSNLQPSNVRRSLLGSLSTQIDQQHQVQQTTRQQQKQLEKENKVVTANFVQGKQAINETVGNKNSHAKKSVSLHSSSNEGNKNDSFSHFQTIPLHFDSDEDDEAERRDTDDDNLTNINRNPFLGKSKGFESSFPIDPMMTPPEELDLQPAIIVGMDSNSSSLRTSGMRSKNNPSTNDDFIQNLRDLLDEEIKSNDDLDDLLMTDAFSFRPSTSSVNTLLGSHDQADPFNYQPTRRGSKRGSANLSSPNQEEQQDYPAFFSNDFSDVNEENSELPHHQQSSPNRSYQRSGWKKEEEGSRKSSATTDTAPSLALNPSKEGNRDERGGKNEKQSHDGVKDMTGATYFLQHPSFSESTESSHDSQEGVIHQEHFVLQDQNQVEVKSKGKQQEVTVSQQKDYHQQQHLLNPLPALLVNHHRSGKETNHKDDDLSHEEDDKKEKVKSDRKERFVLFLQEEDDEEDDEEDAEEQVSESEMIKNNEGSKDIIYSVPHKGMKKKEDDMQRISKSNDETGTTTRVMGEEVPTPLKSSPLKKNTSGEGVTHGKSSSLMAKTTTEGEESNKSKSESNRSSEQEKSGQSRLESNRGWTDNKSDSKTPTSSKDTSGNNNSVKSSINKTPLAVNTGGGRGLPPVRPLLSLHHLSEVLPDNDKGKETGKEAAAMINPLFKEEQQQEILSSFTQTRLSDHHHKDYQENPKGVSSKTEASLFEDENKRSHAAMSQRNQDNDNVDDEDDSQEEVVTFDELDFEVENVNVMNDTKGAQTGESALKEDTRMSIVRDSKGTSIVLPLYPFRPSSSPIFSSHDPSSGIFRSPSRLSTKESFDEVIRLKELYEREKVTRARIEHDLETIKKSGHDDDYHILLKTKIDLEEKYFELRTKHSHLTFDVDKINSEKKQLEKQLDLMKTQENELLKLREEREDLFTQTLHLKQQVNTVRDEMNDSLQVLEQRVQELLQSNTQLTQQNNSLKKELKLKESEVTKRRMEHETDLERVKKEKESLSLDRDTLRTQLQHLQGQMSGENNASTLFNRSYEETNLELVKSVKDLNNAINHLNQRTLQLQEQQAENDRDVAMTPTLIIDMKSLIQDLNQQVSSLKSLKHHEPSPNDLTEISNKLSLVKASLDRLEDKLLKVDQDTSRKTSYIVNGVNGHLGDSSPVWINPSKHPGGHDNNLLIYPALLSHITADRAPKSLFVRNLLQLEDKNSSNSSLKNNNFHDIKNNLEKEITVLKNQLGLFCSNFQAE